MSDGEKKYILAIDPGRDKCGLAVLDLSGEITEKKISPVGGMKESVREIVEKYQPSRIALGDGTGSEVIREIVVAVSDAEIVLIKEKDTTLQARELAWRDCPVCGLWKIMPKLFWPTPTDIDAWAAVVIGRRALDG